jgi:dipeptidyl aminopeptidase/acylaminoacyl peptidase
LWPQFLPGGKRVLYVELDKAAFEYQARVAAFDKPGDAHDVLRSDSRVLFARSPFREGEGYLYYVRAGNLLAQPVDSASLSLLGEPIPLASQVFTFLSTGAASFSVSREGTLAYQRVTRRSRIVWTDRTGREIAVVAPGELTVKYVRLSPDGKKIAASVYNVERGLNEIWILDADGRASRRAASGPGETDGPIWSPDSSSLAYVRAEGRPPQVFLQNVNEQGPEEALAPGGFQIPTDWSPDGRYVAYADTAFPHIENDQGGDVWLVDLKRNRTVVPILNTPFRESSALFAPNGKSLAFIADDSGKPEAYVQAFEGGDEPRLTGERKQVSRAGAVFLRWRPDGKELFYLASDSRVYAVSIGTAFGEPEALFTIPVASRAVLPTAFGFDVSGDGQRFLVAMAGAASPLTVVQNWEAAFTAGGQGKASKPNQE